MPACMFLPSATVKRTPRTTATICRRRLHHGVVADAERWYDPGEVRPRELAINPRCPDFKDLDPTR